MGISFDYEENPNISEADMEEIKKRISLVENSITNKAPRFLEYLDQQENDDYIEIHWPIFEYGITIMFSKLKEKFLISVLDHRNSIVYGNLILSGYRCTSIKELKELGEWSKWRRNKLSIFKPNH